MIVSLGQNAVNVVSVTASQRKTGTRLMALQYAVTAVLTQAEGILSFPGRILELPAEKFNALVTAIVQTANQPGWATNTGFTWTPVFTEAEGAKYLKLRGYRPALPLPGTIATPPVYTPPIRTVVIQPQPEPYYPPAPTPVYRREPAAPPMPTVIAPPVYTPPIRTVVIQPQPEPYYPPAPTPVYRREPAAPSMEAAEGVDRNTILWIVGAVIGGLFLGGMTKQRRG